MPEMVDLTVKAQLIRKGDEVQLAPASEVKVGNKLVHVKRDGATKMTFEIDQAVSVRRLVATEAEKEAERREYMNGAVKRMIESAERDYRKVRDEMIEHLQGEYVTDGWKIDKLFAAEQTWHLWAQVERALKNHPEVEPIDVYEEYAKDYREPRYLPSFASGGFTGNNALEQVKAQVKLEFGQFGKRGY